MSVAPEYQTFDRLLGRLRYDFTDAPEDLLIDQLIEAGRKFAESELFMITLDLSDRIQGSVQDYDYSDLLPDDLSTAKVHSVDFCGCCLYPIDPKCNPCPEGYERCDTDTIRLHPCPVDTAGQTLMVCVCLEPAADACSLPDNFVKVSQSILLNFARYEMMCMPNQEYTNARGARVYRDKARSEMRKLCKKHAPQTDQRSATKKRRKACGTRWLV